MPSALVWLIPFIALVQLAALVIAGMAGGDRDETLEIISPIKDYLVPGATVLWLILSIAGKLPGTGKHRKSLVDYKVQMEMKGAEERRETQGT